MHPVDKVILWQKNESHYQAVEKKAVNKLLRKGHFHKMKLPLSR